MPVESNEFTASDDQEKREWMPEITLNQYRGYSDRFYDRAPDACQEKEVFLSDRLAVDRVGLGMGCSFFSAS